MHKAEVRLNETIVQLVYEVFSQLSQSVGVEIKRTAYTLELKVGVANTSELPLADIEPYVKNIGSLTIGNIFYTPQQKVRKGFFSSLFHYIPDQLHSSVKQIEYKQEIKVWLGKFLEELSSGQKIVGRSVVLYSFLTEYCSVVRSAKNKAIRESRGWHTLACRWIALGVSLVIAIGYFVVAYGAEVERQSEEIHKPRYLYLPPEIAAGTLQSSTQWIYDAMKNVALAISCVVLVEFIFAELRIFRLTFKAWRTFVWQKLTAYNYIFNLHPNTAVKYFLIVICLLGGIVCGTYRYSSRLFLHEKTFTCAEVLDTLLSKTPSEGASFYVCNRNSIDFLDSMYESTVIPAMESCDYLELKKVHAVLKNTKYNKIIADLIVAKRPRMLEKIKAEIAKNEELEVRTVDEYVIPTLNLELVSIIS